MTTSVIDPARGGFTPVAAQMVNDLPKAERTRVLDRLQPYRRRGITVRVGHVVNAIYNIRDGGKP